jgi:RND family efflux transporter MFP subunit
MTVVRVAAVLIVAGFLVGCDPKAAPPAPVRPVLFMVVAPVEATSVAVVGTVQPQFKTDFGFRMLGRLIARSVNVGETVEKGQPLAAVDPFAAELAVRSALAEVSTAQGQLANASGTADRQRTLIETGATTKATLDSAEQGNAAAQAAVIRAQSNLTKAREQLGYTKVSADYSGVVTAIGAEVGQIVSPGQTVVTVARPDVREAVIDVGDELAKEMRIGTRLIVTLQLDPKIKTEGKVREIAPQSDAVTRSRRVRITLASPPETFRLGTTVTTLIPGPTVPGLLVPGTAVFTKNGMSNVWLLDPARRTVASREVQLVKDDGGKVYVTGGIVAGDRVVTAGVHHLKDGQKVRLEQDAAQ